MGRNLAGIKNRLSSISIVKKMMIGYIFIICLPVVLFGFFYYHQVSRMIMDKIDINHQQVMEQAYNNLKVDLAHYESLYKFVQANSFIVDYLDGDYSTDAESVYNYLSYIYPQLMYLLSGNPNISDITLYKYKPNVLAIPNHIADASRLDPAVRQKIGKLKPNQGVWLYHQDGAKLTSLYYYQVLYDSNYTHQIGIMQIKVSVNVLLNFLKAIRADSSWEVYLLNKRGEIVQLASEPVESESFRDFAVLSSARSGHGKTTISNELRIDDLGLNVAAYAKENDMFRDIKIKENDLAVFVIVLLLSLSFLYNMLASSVAKRLSRLARHMRTVGNNSLKAYPNPGDMDEIGFLTSSYNSMVRRIEELIDNVHRAEALRKEAAYRALQAQVKPHFLYNTLETIRMMAVANNVPEVAGIAFSFGQLMRYSLSSANQETKLKQEIEMVASYLDIHRIRMKDRLQFKILGLERVQNVLCPRFILQPVVENCIVHGISKVRRPVWITITISEVYEEEEAYDVLTVEDNGGGMSEAKLLELRKTLGAPAEDSFSGERGGFGLRNVAERIRSFFGGRSGLEIDSETGAGTKVRMFLKKKRDDADDEADDRR
ncbi:cache domain-containing sensor histidine kinase [Paenibacillus humicola]|uniref:cache domain-containing sensor histidine kinase n=1 Tax=Paenibacillus humicola TaxID=3110540 RepID=UPI00237BBD5D|nr:sensor histidine kinase [Paenibacillus humicola]